MSDETEAAVAACREALEAGEVPAVDYSLPVALAALSAVEAERDALRAARDRVLEAWDDEDGFCCAKHTNEAVRALLAVPGENDHYDKET